MRESVSRAALRVVSVLVGGCDRQDPAGPAEWGTLELVTVTEGLDPDPDGYVLQVDGISSLPLPASGTTTVLELTPGNHTVALSKVASQCYTEPALPQSLSITQQELTRLTIQITCLRAYEP
jgi:hypothetical protein